MTPPRQLTDGAQDRCDGLLGSFLAVGAVPSHPSIVGGVVKMPPVWPRPSRHRQAWSVRFAAATRVQGSVSTYKLLQGCQRQLASPMGLRLGGSLPTANSLLMSVPQEPTAPITHLCLLLVVDDAASTHQWQPLTGSSLTKPCTRA